MNIGIIGSGHIGSALARRFTAVGHRVAIANSRGPASLADLARETDARPVAIDKILQDVAVVVVTIPMARIESLPPDLFTHAPPGLVVIDTCNYYPRERDGRITAIESGLTESAWVQQRIGHRVVKAFNTIEAPHLQDFGRPFGAAGRIALSIAGDDADAKAVVSLLIDAIGFDPVDGGSIAESWRQQPGTPGYLKDFGSADLRAALRQALPGRLESFTATDRSPGSYEVPA